MYAPVHYLESEFLVRSNGVILIDPRIGRHLPAALLSRPRLCRAHQGPSYPLMPRFLLHKPAFYEAHGLRYITPICMRTQYYLQESTQQTVTILRYENGGWQSSTEA